MCNIPRLKCWLERDNKFTSMGVLPGTCLLTRARSTKSSWSMPTPSRAQPCSRLSILSSFSRACSRVLTFIGSTHVNVKVARSRTRNLKLTSDTPKASHNIPGTRYTIQGMRYNLCVLFGQCGAYSLWAGETSCITCTHCTHNGRTTRDIFRGTCDSVQPLKLSGDAWSLARILRAGSKSSNVHRALTKAARASSSH